MKAYLRIYNNYNNKEQLLYLFNQLATQIYQIKNDKNFDIKDFSVSPDLITNSKETHIEKEINSLDAFFYFFKLGKTVNFYATPIIEKNINITKSNYFEYCKKIIEITIKKNLQIFSAVMKELFKKYGFIKTYIIKEYYECNIIDLFFNCYLIHELYFINESIINSYNTDEDNMIIFTSFFHDNIYTDTEKLIKHIKLALNKMNKNICDTINFHTIYSKNKRWNTYMVFNNPLLLAIVGLQEQLSVKGKKFQRICKNCHKPFFATNRNQNYCSRIQNEECFKERQNARKIKELNKDTY